MGRLNFCCYSLFDLFRIRYHGDEGTVLAALVELHNTVAKSEEGMVLAHSYILARVVGGATLTDDDIASYALLTAKNLDT